MDNINEDIYKKINTVNHCGLIGTQYDPSLPVDSAKLKNEINIQKDVLAQQAIEVTHKKAEATAKEFVGKVFLYVKQRVVFYSTLTTRS